MGIATVMLIGGIAALKQAASNKEKKSPDYWWSRGGASTAFIMATIALSWVFLTDPIRRTTALSGAIIILFNGLYWLIRRVSYDFKEARRNGNAKSENK